MIISFVIFFHLTQATQLNIWQRTEILWNAVFFRTNRQKDSDTFIDSVELLPEPESTEKIFSNETATFASKDKVVHRSVISHEVWKPAISWLR